MLIRSYTALALCAALMAVAVPANAQSNIDDLVQIDVLDGGETPRGTYMTAFRLTLSDGWKTYWRAPGDAGIPPQFKWQGSRNVGDVVISWPAPHVFNQNGMQSIGYYDQLVLPVEITPAKAGQPVRLKGKMEIGICKDVCIPSTLSFNHQIDTQADRHPAIVAALAQRPYSEKEAGVKSATCRVTPIENGLRVTAKITMPSAGGTEVAVIEPGNPQIWASEAKTTRRGSELTAASDLVHVSQSSFALDRSNIRITILGQTHSVDIQGCSPG